MQSCIEQIEEMLRRFRIESAAGLRTQQSVFIILGEPHSLYRFEDEGELRKNLSRPVAMICQKSRVTGDRSVI